MKPRLTPGDRKLLGKRAAEKVESAGLALVDADYLDDLLRRAQVSYDKAHAEKAIAGLMAQVSEMGRKNAELRDELAETANWHLTGECRTCRAARAAGRRG